MIGRRHTYAGRWPVRSLKVRPATVTTSCDAATRQCMVSALVDFDLASPERKVRSVGTERFQMTLDMSGASPVIVAVSNQTVDRQAGSE